ncbi:hypothetical protein ACVWXN_003505 [Bradyrhizobium sp. i1.4.4]
MIATLRGTSLSKAPAVSSAGDCGIESASRSTFRDVMLAEARARLLHAAAAGLNVDALAYAAGRKDGEEAEFAPGNWDLFSYASGFAFSRQFSTRRKSCAATPSS